MKTPLTAIFLSSTFISSISPCTALNVYAGEKADVVFINGQIETLNSKQAKANAVAVKNEKFIAVGSDQKIKSFWITGLGRKKYWFCSVDRCS